MEMSVDPMRPEYHDLPDSAAGTLGLTSAKPSKTPHDGPDGYLVAETAHDLRTLVSNFKMRLYLAQKMPNRFSEHLNALDYLVNHLDDLVSEFIEVSKPGSCTREPGLLNLNEIAQCVLQTFEPVAHQKEIRLTFDPEPGLWPIWAAGLDIKRIVINLVCNALNYTSAGGLVALSTTQVGSSVVMLVRDTGIGISPQALPHIFERFYRSDEAQGVSSGMGLGLPIVLGLVERYGGHIEVESVLRQGSIFKVTLPGLSD